MSYLAAQNPNNAGGYSIPVGSGAQLLPLPWTNIDEIKVTFNENVTVDSDGPDARRRQYAELQRGRRDVRLQRGHLHRHLDAARGHPGRQAPAGTQRRRQRPDPGRPGQPVGRRVDQPGDHQQHGHQPVSLGQRHARQRNFLFRFNVLPGDVNQDGYVQALDGLLVRGALGSAAGQGNYSIFKDVNGDGDVLSSDGLLVLGRLGTSLPAGQPVAASFPAIAKPAAAPVSGRRR